MLTKILRKNISYKNIAYLGLGSNLGNRYQNFNKAATLLKEFCSIEQTSQIYQSPCIDLEGMIMEKENLFLNAVVKVTTDLPATQLLEKCKSIEQKFHRKAKAKHYEARELDIDILTYNNEHIHKDDLIIPHKELLNRLFVLKPLLDFDKNFTIVDTATGKETVLKDIVYNFCNIFKTAYKPDKTCYLVKTWNVHVSTKELSYDLSKRPLLMGVINCTPDSFSGGLLKNKDDYLNIIKLLKENKDHIDIIDIGGESTRPGAKEVDQHVELERVAKLIQLIREDSELKYIPISIDTRKVKCYINIVLRGF
jgi:2-amino-4-hydroxy-6-hydroxymethyldihydropteridine diphosphokinase